MCYYLLRSSLFLLLSLPRATSESWGLLFDCGSSGTRAHIYHWNGLDGTSLSEFIPASPHDANLLQVRPGISSFASTPLAVVPYLESLLVQTKRWVPVAAWHETRIRAFATAGMRLLTAAEQWPLWDAAAASLAESGFLFDGDAATISGNYEALWFWMATRFILEQAGGTPPLLGALDLGGASTQISFLPASGVITQDAYMVTHNASTATVYSHSYMRLGQDQAVLRVAQQLADAAAPAGEVANPCFNEGLVRNLTVSCASGAPCTRTFVGKGPADYASCRKLAAALPTSSACLLPPCAIDGVYQPSPAGSAFYAGSAFWYTVNGIGLCGELWPATLDGGADRAACAVSWHQIEEAGAAFCAKPWAEVQSEYAINVCFGAAYVPSLLEAYAVPPDSTAVTYVNKLQGFAVSWALGAQIYAIDEMRCEIATDTVHVAIPTRAGSLYRDTHSDTHRGWWGWLGTEQPGAGAKPSGMRLVLGLAVSVALLAGVVAGVLGSRYASVRAVHRMTKLHEVHSSEDLPSPRPPW